MPPASTIIYDPADDRPYYETVVTKLLIGVNAVALIQVCHFIIATACPANHDTIIKVLRARRWLLTNDIAVTDKVIREEIGQAIDQAIAALETKKAMAELKAEVKS